MGNEQEESKEAPFKDSRASETLKEIQAVRSIILEGSQKVSFDFFREHRVKWVDKDSLDSERKKGFEIKSLELSEWEEQNEKRVDRLGKMLKGAGNPNKFSSTNNFGKFGVLGIRKNNKPTFEMESRYASIDFQENQRKRTQSPDQKSLLGFSWQNESPLPQFMAQKKLKKTKWTRFDVNTEEPKDQTSPSPNPLERFFEFPIQKQKKIRNRLSNLEALRRASPSRFILNSSVSQNLGRIPFKKSSDESSNQMEGKSISSKEKSLKIKKTKSEKVILESRGPSFRVPFHFERKTQKGNSNEETSFVPSPKQPSIFRDTSINMESPMKEEKSPSRVSKESKPTKIKNFFQAKANKFSKVLNESNLNKKPRKKENEAETLKGTSEAHSKHTDGYKWIEELIGDHSVVRAKIEKSQIKSAHQVQKRKETLK